MAFSPEILFPGEKDEENVPADGGCTSGRRLVFTVPGIRRVRTEGHCYGCPDRPGIL